MTKRRKIRAIIHVQQVRLIAGRSWAVIVEWPFKVRGHKAFSTIARYKMKLHASNLADHLEGELQGAEIVIHD